MINKKKSNFKKKSNLRFSPDPNGFLHIGHFFNIFINYYYSNKKKGFFYLRFDNTNLKKYNILFYNYIIFDILWIGIKWTKIKYFLNEIKIFFIILCYYFKKKIIYFKKNVLLIRINFNYLNYLKIINFLLYKNNFFIKNFIFFIKKKIIMRKKKKYHHINYFPTYDFSQSLNDYINKINISICTKEFEKNSFFYNYLLKKIKKKSYQIEFEKKIFKYNKISKRKLKNKFFFNIFYFRKIGFYPKLLFILTNNIGVSNKKSFLRYINIKNLFKIKNNYEKIFLYNIFFLINNKKNLIFSIFKNEKNININFNNFLIKKKIKINIFFFSYNIFKKNLFFNKKVFFKNFLFLKKNILIIKIIKINKNINYFINNGHCLYDNKLKFKKSILKNN